MQSRALIAGAFAALFLLGSPPAQAAAAGDEPVAGNNRGWTDGTGVVAEAGATNETPKSPAAPTSASKGPTCTYHALPAEQAAIADSMAEGGIGPAKGTGPGSWVRKVCVDEKGSETGTVVWSPRRAPVDPVALAQQAMRYAPLPAPALGMSPSSDRDQLVNVPTWLWVDPAAWRPVSANASAGGVTVTTSAKPVRVVWDPGDGLGPVACNGPGTPYDPSQPAAAPTCSHTYLRPAERAVVTATVEWGVRWSSTAGGSGELGVVRRSSSVPVRVAESQAINVLPAGRPS